MAQEVKNLPATQENSVRSLGQEDPLEKEIATCSSVLPEKFHAQRSLAGYSSGVPRVGQDLATKLPPPKRGKVKGISCHKVKMKLPMTWVLCLPRVTHPVKTRVFIVPSVKICRTPSRIWVSSSFNEPNISASSSSTCERCIAFSLWLLFLKAHKEDPRKSGDSRVAISLPRTAFSQFLHASQ